MLTVGILYHRKAIFLWNANKLLLCQPSSSVVHFVSGWPSSMDSVRQVFFPASSFILWRRSRLRFRAGVIFSLYFSTGKCNYGSRLKCNDVLRQLYIIMSQNNRAKALKDLTPCIQDIMSWNVSNMLKCTPNKTEKIRSSTHFSPAKLVPSIKIGDVSNE